MIDGYRTQIASYVGGMDPQGEASREGWACELLDASGTPIAEVFKEDGSDLRTVTIFENSAIKLTVIEEFLQIAAERL